MQLRLRCRESRRKEKRNEDTNVDTGYEFQYIIYTIRQRNEHEMIMATRNDHGSGVIADARETLGPKP